MEFQRADKLLKRYWRGETNSSEEEEMRIMLLRDGGAKLEDHERPYFDAVNRYAHADLPESFDEKILEQIEATVEQNTALRFGKAAAVIILLLAGGYTIWQMPATEKVEVAEMQDAQKAFELTKQALYMFSSELNRGASFAMELENFDATIDKIKSKDGSSEVQ
ncbi:MAG: hypothetical protein HKN87_18275 [Saprospiraceae bacterium]|nr:hypothetical protein [Saprospiraceae bacterium]